MKSLVICRNILMLVFAGIFPALLFAREKEIYDRPQSDLRFKQGISAAIDSIPIRRGNTDKVDQERPRDDRRLPEDIRTGNQRPGDDKHRFGPRSGIKQVPRSIPKVKPQAVTDRIPIRRPPMKIPRKGFGGFHIQ